MLESGVVIGKSGMYRNAVISIGTGEQLVFGRDGAVANIVVNQNAAKVSRKHCALTYNGPGKGFLLTDHSSNGTFVNGARVKKGKPLVIQAKSIISLGNDNNCFYLGDKTSVEKTLGLNGDA